jgi:threonine efflux protein
MNVDTMLPTLLTIAVLHWAVLLIPGFNFILIGQLAAGDARSKALAAVAGMTTATLTWALLAVMGVGVIFSMHPVLRQVAQIAGGLYLLQLAYRLWGARGQPSAQAQPVLSHAGAFRAGITTGLLNPKLALFYGSVFATAMPAQPSLVLAASAVLLVFMNSVVWHTSLALALSHPVIQRAYLRHVRRLNQVSALVVGAFGVRLLVATAQEFRARAGG